MKHSKARFQIYIDEKLHAHASRRGGKRGISPYISSLIAADWADSVGELSVEELGELPPEVQKAVLLSRYTPKLDAKQEQSTKARK